MIGRQLHDFDLILCAYVLGNIVRYVDDREFAVWIKGGLPPRLERYVLANLDNDDSKPLILDDLELFAIVSLLDTPPELDRHWIPEEAIHRRHIFSVREVRDNLSPSVAEDWARACSRYARGLEARRLKLQKGAEIVRDWIGEIRMLLKALGATRFLPYPAGDCPTPTIPMPLLVPPPDPAGSGPDPDPVGRDPAGRSTEAHAGERPSADPSQEILGAVSEMRDLLISQRQVRDYYSTEQVAAYLGKANWTVREWCRLGRVNADKRHSGRGRSLEWVIPHAELLRIEKEGLLPLPKH